MKSLLWGCAFLLIVSGTGIRLSHRWHEESADHKIALLADWSELRQESLRLGMSDQELLRRIRSAGANALLVSPSTVQDYLAGDMTFKSRPLAESVLRQLLQRGIAGARLQERQGSYRLTNPSSSWESLKDIELGFNPELLGLARQEGLHLALRINNDPWLTKENLFAGLTELSAANEGLAVMLNTDEVPGGADAIPDWVRFIKSQNIRQVVFEFHPSKSAMKIAARAPETVYRAHTVPTAELKDLLPPQEISRWRRAVVERSCRFLLFHLAPNDSLPSFLDHLQMIRGTLSERTWVIGWPGVRPGWSAPSSLEHLLGPILALAFAILSPIVALRVSLGRTPWVAYGIIFGGTLLGACVMASLSDNPLARLEIVPFRGVKLAFVAAWAGSFLLLFQWDDVKTVLDKNIRRIDVLAGLAVAAIAGYFIIRTGNAGSGWKIGWEQGFRDKLEILLIARPRFKEFVIGYPLLLYGLHLALHPLPKRWWEDGRLWIGIGMIGPISMVNTFCHLHSPLYLAFWRSANGFVIGTLLGLLLLTLRPCRS